MSSWVNSISEIPDKMNISTVNFYWVYKLLEYFLFNPELFIVLGVRNISFISVFLPLKFSIEILEIYKFNFIRGLSNK